jgi:hypothetical protein
MKLTKAEFAALTAAINDRAERLEYQAEDADRSGMKEWELNLLREAVDLQKAHQAILRGSDLEII